MQVINSYKVKIVNMNDCLKETIEIYRKAVSYFINVVTSERELLEKLSSKYRVNLIEHLTHSTKDNPHPEYDGFDRQFYKFPSYLRRSAIMDAMGIVSSYYSNLENYKEERYTQVSSGKKFKKKAPKLQVKHYKCPALYRGNMFKMLDRNHAQIKIYKNNDWVWLKASLRKQDIKYIEKNCRGREFSPILVRKGRNYYLQFAYENKVEFRETSLKDRVVVSVDLGINHSAVCSAVDSKGTVTGRKFINQPEEKDLMNHLVGRLCRKQKQSGKKAKLTRAWNKINNLKREITNRTVHEIVSFAEKVNADTVVFEYLDRFPKIKGSRNKRIRMKLQMWTKIAIQNKVKHKAHSAGMRFSRVTPKNTSLLAYDGSGSVKRNKDNFSLCTFSTGKQYNCDLSASYNIGARYFIREYQKSIPAKEWSEAVAKEPGLLRRTQSTLATLISLAGVVQIEK